jgi:hypothetical protein
MKKTTIAFLSIISPCMASGMLADINLDEPTYYHRETVLMSPCKQFGGLYIQWPDEPFSLAKRPVYKPKPTDAPKAKGRSLREKEANMREPAVPAVFDFLKGLNERS